MSTYFTEDHEWVLVEGDIATIGITAHAAEQLGEIVFIEQKEAGETFEKGDEIGVIESVKAASEIYAPVDGEITEVNEDLPDAPASINENPESDAWIYKIKMSDKDQLSDLMDQKAYTAFIE